ncbi:hypothetical protein M8J76_011142 [Diaphorina citri]|nr:hypothetical protein M8J76_011142 [Diaphorina citri]
MVCVQENVCEKSSLSTSPEVQIKSEPLEPGPSNVANPDDAESSDNAAPDPSDDETCGNVDEEVKIREVREEKSDENEGTENYGINNDATAHDDIENDASENNELENDASQEENERMESEDIEAGGSELTENPSMEGEPEDQILEEELWDSDGKRKCSIYCPEVISKGDFREEGPHICPICPTIVLPCEHLLKEHMRFVHGWFKAKRNFLSGA